MGKKHSVLTLTLLAALIPAVMLLVCFALLGSIPFGDDTILMYDSSIQYLDFAAYLKTIFSGENDIFYTFSKNLGGEVVSLIGYYLLSPFSILFLLGSVRTLPAVFTLVVVLKIAACGAAFFWASARRFGCKASHLIFSTAYALMAYNTLYGWNIMWMDGVLILPLLALGLERLWRGEKPWLYTGCLAYALLTNFYIGYMLCIASVLFSLTLMAVGEGRARQKAGLFGKFVLASCVGGFAAAVSWLPTFFTLIGGRGEAVSSTFVWARTFNILGLAGKLVAGSADAAQLELGIPHIFCGIFTILLVMLFFLNGKNSVKNRLAALGVLLALVVSFSIRGLDVIWHGFSPNNAFNFRYSFIFSYILLVIAGYTWEQRREMNKITVVLAGGMLLIMCAGLLLMKQRMDLTYLSHVGLAVSAGVTVVSVAVLLLPGEPRRLAGAVLALVCLSELGANYCLSMDAVMADGFRLNLASYQRFVDQTEPAVEAVKQMDGGFYRMEKTFSRNKNDAMLLSYNGLTHFSSSQDKAVPRFMENLGMTSMEGIWSQYGSGSTALVDALLGVKYVLSHDDLAAQKGYVLQDTVNGIGIYENPYVLPVAMLPDAAILREDLQQQDCFQIQARMLALISGNDNKVLIPEENVDITLLNLVETADGVYSPEDADGEAALTYSFTASQDKPLYFYFCAPEQQDVTLYLNGQNLGSYFSPYRWDVVCGGTREPGEPVEITLVPHGETLVVEKALFCYEDLRVLDAAAQSVCSKPVTLTRVDSSHFAGSFDSDGEQAMLLTIPYDLGWRVTVDGVPATVSKALGVFMAVEIPQGSHHLELYYIPRGMAAGCALSAAALAVALLWYITEKKKMRRA